jgi:hypothetical protein
MRAMFSWRIFSAAASSGVLGACSFLRLSSAAFFSAFSCRPSLSRPCPFLFPSAACPSRPCPPFFFSFSGGPSSPALSSAFLLGLVCFFLSRRSLRSSSAFSFFSFSFCGRAFSAFSGLFLGLAFFQLALFLLAPPLALRQLGLRPAVRLAAVAA